MVAKLKLLIQHVRCVSLGPVTYQTSQLFVHCYISLQNKLQLFYNKIRLSVQRSYGVLLKPACNISIHHYRVYKHFVIQGYKLFRHEIFHKSTVPKETKELKTLSSYGMKNHKRSKIEFFINLF